MWDACPDKVTGHADRSEVQGPAFGQGLKRVTSLAADPSDPTRVLVTNGLEAWKTTDAGCTWQRALPIYPPANMTAVGHEGDAMRAVAVNYFVSVSNQGMFNLQIVGTDGGAMWQNSLPAQMSAYECTESNRCLVRFAAGQGLRVAYAATGGPAARLPVVGRSLDGGKQWVVREAPKTGEVPQRVMDLAIDPADPDHVLAIADGTVFESRDGAATWDRGRVPRPLSLRARLAFADGAVVVDSTDDRTTTVMVSGDGGRIFRDALSTPEGPVTAAVSAPTPAGPALHVAAGGGVYNPQPGKGLAPRVSAAAAVVGLSATSTGVWAYSDKPLFIAADPSAATAPPRRMYRPPSRPTVRPADEVRAKAYGGRLDVGERVIVAPGQTASTTVFGALSRQPRGLDVFFLMDTTGSMTAKIQPMAMSFAAVVDDLNKQGVPARFGLATYGDRGWRYRRLADLGTPPAEVQRHLSQLAASGGDEFHYTSFYQLATGAGVVATQGGDVPPGLHASFAPGALHIVLHATDDIDRGDPDGPDRHTALDALNDVRVRHVGIYPWSLPTGGVPGFEDAVYSNLKDYALATSTFAPADGIDCNGDGLVDIEAGQPIVCSVPGGLALDAPIAELITRVLLSFAGRQPASLHAAESPLGVAITPASDYGALDLAEAHDDLEFAVDVTCPAEVQGSVVDLPLELHVDGVPVAKSALSVDCLAAPRPVRPLVEPTTRPVPPRVVGLVPPAAQAPPALAQSVASAQATSSASSSASAQAAQIGMAVAPDDVVQVVTEEAGDDEMRFVRRDKPAPSPVVPAALGLAVVVLGLAVRPRVIEQRSQR